MALQQWALPQISQLLPLESDELREILAYTETLSDAEVAGHLGGLLGDTPEAAQFISAYNGYRAGLNAANAPTVSSDRTKPKPKPGVDDSKIRPLPTSLNGSADVKGNGSYAASPASYAPPPGPSSGSTTKRDSKSVPSPGFAPPQGPPPGASRALARHHTNDVIEAGRLRARDEQQMQQNLMDIQYRYRIYNSDIEPEHETDYPCSCDICSYKRRKYNRYGIQDQWSRAVMYPGEKIYNDNTYYKAATFFNGNPYQFRVVSPYGYRSASMWGPQRPIPSYYTRSIHQTIVLNEEYNTEAQRKIDGREPKHDIWHENPLEHAISRLSINDSKSVSDKKTPVEKEGNAGSISTTSAGRPPTKSRLSSFRKSIGIKSSEERAVGKAEKDVDKGKDLRDRILREEQGRWPDEEWRFIVMNYQDKVGMTRKIAELRGKSPIQYLHLLKAGYFEPIPVAWANDPSNPLKFSIEASAGWRGITPAWRGYEDTAEERLYWVLNHREEVTERAKRLKPDFISEMKMARDRMAKAVDPPPLYYAVDDTCHLQHTSTGYSKQVMPSAFKPADRPEVATDDTMILLDVSGSMDFDPVRPVYNEYLITSYTRSTQPKNKDVAKAIIRRFTDAMANHDHQFRGYDLTTFASEARYIGTINHRNLNEMWRNVRLGGGTRVMTGWQKVKELHFQKHSESATHHPVYGWQAGPQTPILRLLLLLDGEATDMDEFELDLLGLSWAHVTIFLIGVDGCPHHHRHANELQRISDVNHHVSFVDAQGNFPERFVTHELLKRHLGYEVSMQEFEQMEELPPYSA